MYPKLIKTEADYEAALAQVDRLMSAIPGSPEADALELWVHLTEEYEGTHFPIPAPDPVSAIRFRMEQDGLKAADLIPYMGSKSRVSEVLRGKRALSLGMIRRLNKGLGISLQSLMGEKHSQATPVATSMK